MYQKYGMIKPGMTYSQVNAILPRKGMYRLYSTNNEGEERAAKPMREAIAEAELN